VVGVATNLMVLLAAMLQPFMPATARRIRHFCNIVAPHPATPTVQDGKAEDGEGAGRREPLLRLPDRFVRFLPEGHRHNQVFGF
jgi:methionyl-tRNA synthetase